MQKLYPVPKKGVAMRTPCRMPMLAPCGSGSDPPALCRVLVRSGPACVAPCNQCQPLSAVTEVQARSTCYRQLGVGSPVRPLPPMLLPASCKRSAKLI